MGVFLTHLLMGVFQIWGILSLDVRNHKVREVLDFPEIINCKSDNLIYLLTYENCGLQHEHKHPVWTSITLLKNVVTTLYPISKNVAKRVHFLFKWLKFSIVLGAMKMEYEIRIFWQKGRTERIFWWKLYVHLIHTDVIEV